MSEITFEYIESAVSPYEFQSDGADAYENAANYACKVILGAARRDPVGFRQALDVHRESPYGDSIEAMLTADERSLLFEGRYGLTGFQWGWAVKTAAWLLEQPDVPNGAILHLKVRDE